jgi:hypothetical protein
VGEEKEDAALLSGEGEGTTDGAVPQEPTKKVAASRMQSRERRLVFIVFLLKKISVFKQACVS